MNITSEIKLGSGKGCKVEYIDCADESELVGMEIQSVHAFCFFRGQLLLVYAPKKDSWTPPGGGVEEGESVPEAVIREVKEESNMRVIAQKLIGFQKIYESDKVIVQTRSVCLVEPIDTFEFDPDGDITEIKLIDPEDYKTYFDWGEIGEHIMKRALMIKDNDLLFSI